MLEISKKKQQKKQLLKEQSLSFGKKMTIFWRDLSENIVR